MEQEITEVRLVADYFDGKPVHEAVPAVRLEENRYRLTASPGFAPGAASGDEIELAPSEKLGYRILKRSGNICVQIFLTKCDPADRAKMTETVRAAGGWLDGGSNARGGHLLIFTFPITLGFASIERAMQLISNACAVDRWMYGNVYDTSDGKTPLNWWKDF